MRLYYGGFSAPQPALKRLTVAHRGTLHSGLPDNSLAGFEEALRLGVEILEVDARLSASGDLFLFHDGILHHENFASPENLTGREVQSLSPEELRSARLHGDIASTVPLLVDALRLIKNHPGTLEIDLKQENDLLIDRVADIIRDEGAAARALIQVRNPERIARLKTRLPGARVLARCRSQDDLAIALREGVEAVELEGWLSEQAIRQAHDHKTLVMFNVAGSRCDSEETWGYLRARGVDMVMTNHALGAR
jgi:glycerophosphoryl diester phosphodiesterase